MRLRDSKACNPIYLGILVTAIAGCHGQTESAPSQARASGELILFHAGSLAVPLREVSELYQQRNPGVVVKAEAAGSRDVARRVSDLGRTCDVLASADYKVVEELLLPEHAEFNIRFATNEMGIAYTNRSKLAGEVKAENWHEILLRPEEVLLQEFGGSLLLRRVPFPRLVCSQAFHMRTPLAAGRATRKKPPVRWDA